MAGTTNFFGYEFETDYNLFGDEFEEVAGVFVIYTPKAYLDIGTTENLKTSLETHQNTADWIRLSEGEEILVAFYLEEDPGKRVEIESHLRVKMQPRCQSS